MSGSHVVREISQKRFLLGIYCAQIITLTEVQEYMATIQVTVPDQQLSALQRKAEAAKLTVDELIQQTIAELLVNSSDREKAVNYVLNKNKELYKRLA